MSLKIDNSEDAAALSSSMAEVAIHDENKADPKVESSLLVLRELQQKYDALYEEFTKERRALEELYESRFQPLYKERSKELEKGCIPHFWLTAFENCELLRENITDKDATCLRYLTDINCVEASPSGSSGTAETSTGEKDRTPGSYTLSFHFGPNPFFENEVLTKTYVMEEGDDQELDQAIGCAIKWKTGKDLTTRIMKKKIRGGRGGAGKVLTRKEPCDSFFNFFSPPKVPEDGDEVQEEDIEALEEVIGADYELGETIRHDIIARAVMYFEDKVEHDSENEEEEEEIEKDAGGDGAAVNGSNGEDADSEGSDSSSDVPSNSGLPPPAQNPEDCKQQ